MIITDQKQLKVKCTDASEEEAKEIIAKLVEELNYSASVGKPGIGLAAPQIGINKNVVIIRVGDISLDLVNPKIVKSYDLSLFDNEGCLSFPGLFEQTMRYNEVVVINDNEPKIFTAAGLPAVVIQHECDHLVGKLLPDFALKRSKVKIRPNDPCSCKSGKKYKKCCG